MTQTIPIPFLIGFSVLDETVAKWGGWEKLDKDLFNRVMQVQMRGLFPSDCYWSLSHVPRAFEREQWIVVCYDEPTQELLAEVILSWEEPEDVDMVVVAEDS